MITKAKGNIWRDVYTFTNINKAHRKGRKNKTHYKWVKRIDEDASGKYLQRIQRRLREEIHVTAKYREFTINDRGKEREICDLPYYPDRIVHWAVMLQVEPILVSTFVKNSYAAIPGRGAHLAISDVCDALHKDPTGTKYCLRLDVHKYFPSINHKILKGLLRKKIKCKSTLSFFDELIDSYHSKLTNEGVPIGNYPSQYFGNYYLTFFDHWLKEGEFVYVDNKGVKRKKKVKYSYRYMDDIVILDDSKEFLHSLRIQIEDYLMSNLKLKIKNNYQVYPVNECGISFVGYRLYRNYVLLSTKTKRRINKRCKEIKNEIEFKGYMTEHNRCVLSSYKGVLDWCNGKRLYFKNLYKLKPYMKSLEEYEEMGIFY